MKIFPSEADGKRPWSCWAPYFQDSQIRPHNTTQGPRSQLKEALTAVRITSAEIMRHCCAGPFFCTSIRCSLVYFPTLQWSKQLDHKLSNLCGGVHQCAALKSQSHWISLFIHFSEDGRNLHLPLITNWSCLNQDESIWPNFDQVLLNASWNKPPQSRRNAAGLTASVRTETKRLIKAYLLCYATVKLLAMLTPAYVYNPAHIITTAACFAPTMRVYFCLAKFVVTETWWGRTGAQP